MNKIKFTTFGLTILSLVLASCNLASSQDNQASSGEQNNYFSISISSNESSSSSLDDSKYNLKPISNDLMSFYERNINLDEGSQEYHPLSISYLYDTFKNKPDYFVSIKEKYMQYDLIGENKYHCYYVTIDILDASNKAKPIFGSNYTIYFSVRGITNYFIARNTSMFSKEMMNQPILEMEVSSSIESVPTKIDNYYLLDIVRYYQPQANDNITSEPHSFICFSTYSEIDGYALIDQEANKDTLTFCGNAYHDYLDILPLNNYYLLNIFDYYNLEILNKNNVAVVIESFAFDSAYTKDNPAYYDDIESCIVSKEYAETTNYGNNTREFYDIVFDYKKIEGLFGLNTNE